MAKDRENKKRTISVSGEISLYDLIDTKLNTIFSSYFNKYVIIETSGYHIRFDDSISYSQNDIEVDLLKKGQIIRSSSKAQFHDNDKLEEDLILGVDESDTEIVFHFKHKTLLRIYSVSGRSISYTIEPK